MLGAGAAGMVGAQVAGAIPAGAEEADPPEFRTRLTERYAMKYPIVQAGFSALYVTPELTAAVSNAGGLGCLGAAPEPAEGVRNLIRRTKVLTSRPFGMDFVYFPMGGATVWSPGFENDREHRTRELNWSCTDAHIDAWGADVIIAQGMQAGGHNRGYMDGEPSLRQELVPRVREAVPPEVVVLGAGGVADGRTLAASLREGAEAAWVGTIFAAAEESYAHDEYKRRVVEVENGWTETRENRLFGPEWPGGYTRAIVNRVMEEWQGREDAQTSPPPPGHIGEHRLGIYTVPGGIPYQMPKFSLMLPTRDTTGDFEEMALLAGAESSPLVKRVQKAADIVVEMGEGARSILTRRT
jgi:enoyl-[acyl-carrier protein] reductase II